MNVFEPVFFVSLSRPLLDVGPVLAITGRIDARDITAC